MLRAVRCSPHLSIETAAQAAGMTSDAAAAALTDAAARGRCAQTAKALSLTVGGHGDALAHPACPPAVVAAAQATPRAAAFANGPAAWRAVAAYRVVAGDDRRPSSMVRALGNGRVPLQRLLLEMAKDSRCPPAALLRLAGGPDCEVAARAAANHRCPPAALAFSSGPGQSREARVNAAANPNSPASVLVRLAADGNRYIISAVAANSNCPPRLLGDIAAATPDTAGGETLRRIVATNEACPSKTLQALSRDRSLDVRIRVARHPRCSTPLLRQLAADEREEVRAEVADNRQCPPETLDSLRNDASSLARSSAERSVVRRRSAEKAAS